MSASGKRKCGRFLPAGETKLQAGCRGVFRTDIPVPSGSRDEADVILGVAVDEISDVIKLAFAEQQHVTTAREERIDTFQQFRDFRSRIGCRERRR